ncbi:hypothetical protein [Arthrobacter sp. IK3]|uniref:hypothetical protein n=1 Tax=Arthrobacter sp. IK3 TaxID=3448169 RepID=UPI003EDEE26C
MDKTMVRQREDGTTYLEGYAPEYPVNGDALVLFGWKAKGKLLDRATKIFVESSDMVSRARKELGISEDDRSADAWAVAGQVHAVLPGGIPAFVAATPSDARAAA